MTRAISRLLPGVAVWAVAAVLPGAEVPDQRLGDPGFDTAVARPAYPRVHPTVAIDEAHGNFHTAVGRYKPLADLLGHDGYRVVRGTKAFTRAGLAGIGVLIVSNATAPGATDSSSGPAFAEAECDAVRDWVRAGGSLLLIADHEPYGSAAANLARRFGVDMGKGSVFDLAHSEPGQATVLAYSRDNGLLGTHPIVRGRGPGEEVRRAVAFTGQSLGVPAGATALLKLGPAARESATFEELEAALVIDKEGKSAPTDASIAAHSKSVAGRAQGLAMKYGKGRLVVMAEAAMFSAQVIRDQQDGKPIELKMGMNVPGNDDRQLALNVLHWLSGLLD